MSARSRLVTGVVLIVIAALWLLRGIVFLLTTASAAVEVAGSFVGLLLAALLLVLGVSLVRRGRRVPS